MLNLEAAKAELLTKSYNDIQKETAWKWASRAAVTFQEVVRDPINALSSWIAAEEYFHEAVEHAALYDDTTLLAEIRDAVRPYEVAAHDLLDTFSAPFEEKEEG